MPILFHGTRFADASAMQDDGHGDGGIDVTRGSGEFGRGFYTQTSVSNALSFVQNRFPANQRPCILQLNIDDAEYDRLSQRVLTAKQAAALTQRLRSQQTTGTHLEGVDVVVGPLNSWADQHKFESGNAQVLLNGPETQRTVR